MSSFAQHNEGLSEATRREGLWWVPPGKKVRVDMMNVVIVMIGGNVFVPSRSVRPSYGIRRLVVMMRCNASVFFSSLMPGDSPHSFQLRDANKEKDVRSKRAQEVCGFPQEEGSTKPGS
jgi:hypothetical protein